MSNDTQKTTHTDSSREPEPRWREDFPIQWERDHYVTRREFAKFLTLGSSLLVAANAVIAAIGLGRRKPQAPEALIGSASAVPPDGTVLFRYPTDKDPCILIRNKSGQLLAYSQVCTHLSCAVIHEPDQNQLFCPCHHGCFSTGDGRPLAGPPTRALPKIKLKVRGDDIYAVGVEI
ncbi:MAG: ubiquinol-cytochrome c reductase iron-sulfur subunit [Blastocatellia bacterium]